MLSNNPHPMIAAFIDISEGKDHQIVFNGLQNFLVAHIADLSNSDWNWAMWLAGELLPDAQAINELDDFEQLEEALHRLTHTDNPDSLLNIIYVQCVLTHKGIWEDFCAYMRTVNSH